MILFITVQENESWPSLEGKNTHMLTQDRCFKTKYNTECKLTLKKKKGTDKGTKPLQLELFTSYS
jgi:hypothetical protein